MKKIISSANHKILALTLPSAYAKATADKHGRRGKRKVLIALSGGIDSAVSAWLLDKQGYEVEAAFMKNWSSTAGLLKNECPWLVDRQDALRVAAFLRIPMHTLDFEKQYEKNVLNYFFKEYQAGRTPNPDVMCNKEIKFKLLYNWALERGFDYLATGHYAQVGESENRVNRRIGTSSRGVIPSASEESLNVDGHLQVKGSLRSSTFAKASADKSDALVGRDDTKNYQLVRSADEFKDQTYFIYNIKTEQLPHLMFPIGGMKKAAVRSLARKIGLPNAEKRESMGLCFVGKIRLKDFLEQKLKVKTGNIVFSMSGKLREGQPARRSLGEVGGFGWPTKQSHKSKEIASAALAISERVVGQHQGLHNYTIGQRQGIKVGASGPYYVFKKDLKSNTLYVTNDPEDERLLVKEIQIHSTNWLVPNIQYPISNISLFGRYRHQGKLVPLTISQIKNDLYKVVFKKPQKAVASGQSLVLYDGKVCVGGGVIA